MILQTMKSKLLRVLYLIPFAVLGVSCSVPTASPLYYWGGYQEATYKYYKEQTPESICGLIVNYEYMIQHPGGTRQVPPPGICAEYAYLLQAPGTAEIFAEHATKEQKKLFEGDDYATIFHEKSLEMFKKEIELYPESEKFIKPIFKNASN